MLRIGCHSYEYTKVTGTGLSSTITAELLQKQGSPTEQASFLKHFRADNIGINTSNTDKDQARSLLQVANYLNLVRDAEAVRKALTKEYPESKKKWSVLGQSFGGFCAVTYLYVSIILLQLYDYHDGR